jgi:uncharacterized protein
MSNATKGFASMTTEERKRIASMGGKAVSDERRTFRTNRELAAEAGRKGGLKARANAAAIKAEHARLKIENERLTAAAKGV